MRSIHNKKVDGANGANGANGAKETQAQRVRQASRARREQQKESLQRTILDAAGQLFLEQGYEGFSMRRVAERIGYSATTIYRYYEDKDDLLFAVVNEGFSQFARQLTEAAEGASNPLKRLEALGHAYISFGLNNPVYYQMMFMQRADLLFESQREQTRPMIESFDMLQSAVRAAMDDGVMKRGDVLTYSRVIWSMVHGVTALALADPKRFTPEVVEKNTRLAMKMMLNGLK
jgi:AcrR family transcriptional regulator